MNLLNVRPAEPGGKLRARVDVELQPGIRLHNVAIKETPSGWRAFAPSAFGSPAVTFTRDIAEAIVAAARVSLGEIARNDRSRAA